MASTSASRTPSSAGNRRKFTLSVWCKKHSSSQMNFIGAGSVSDQNHIQFADDRFRIRHYAGGHTLLVSTKALLRDPSAWYHLVVGIDTTQSTNSDGVKVYVNGSLISGTYHAYNQDISTSFNKSGSTMALGHTENDGGNHYDGYISETNFIDGTQLDASYFGETNDNGVWIPKKYTGSYGTNGFFLEYQQTGTSQNSSGIGADTSGNDNHFAVTNLAATDITTDVPTNNFATLNPANKYASPLVTEGNLEYDSNSSSGSSMVSTIAPSNGKWYCEAKLLTSTLTLGVAEVGKTNFDKIGGGASRPQIDYTYGGDVNIDETDVDNEATYTTNDIIGILLNLDDNEVIFQKNGASINSGTAYNLHTNTTQENTGFYVQTHTGSGNTKASFNFGNPAFAISSGNADANGYGNFEYSVPSGYYALCTKNLAEYG